jgi:hypothetical protein
MIRGSRSSCHRAFLAVLAVVLCVVAPVSAAAQTRTHFATSESMTALWVARERGLFEKPWPGDAVCGHAVPATGALGIAGR